MKKTYLITGGTGFIGSNIANMLLKQGQKVVVFDNNSRGKASRIFLKSKNLIFINGDIRDKSSLKKAFKKKITTIIHLAYINGTKYFYKKPDLILDIATKGLINIYDLAIKFRVKEIFLASSSEVYHSPKIIPTLESESLKIPDIFNPRYSYGGGKILTELYAINFGRKFFKRTIIFRPHNVYGADMGNEHVIPEFIRRFKHLKSKTQFKIQGTGNEKRSFIHIDDFCQAFDKILKKGKNLNIYNIGTTEIIKIKKVVLLLQKIFKKKIHIKHIPLRSGGTKKRCPNIDKIKRLGFKQKITLNEGLKKIIQNKK